MSGYVMADLGQGELVLGMKVTRDRYAGTLKISHAANVKSVLEGYGMFNCIPVCTPRGVPKLSNINAENTWLNPKERRLYQAVMSPTTSTTSSTSYQEFAASLRIPTPP